MPNSAPLLNPARMMHLPAGEYSMLVMRDAAAHLDQARGYLERCSDARPHDAVVMSRALTLQILAEALDQYIAATVDAPAPRPPARKAPTLQAQPRPAPLPVSDRLLAVVALSCGLLAIILAVALVVQVLG